MPHLNIEALIQIIKSHMMELHSCYVDCKDFSLADRLLAETYRMENVLRSLESLQKKSWWVYQRSEIYIINEKSFFTYDGLLAQEN